jgi:hypothetical protein
MPNTIFTAFLDAGMVTEQEWAALREESQQIPFMEAHLASRTVNVNVEFVGELQHPKVGAISGDFFTEKLSKFTFEDIMIRQMDDLIRIRIDRCLEEMKATRWSEYDGKIRRVFMITELYYGTIKMVVEKQFSAELDVPFAMRIERIRNFNG